jgi:hypothetical protein
LDKKGAGKLAPFALENRMLKKTKRPEDWGQREKHELYSVWVWHKSRNRYGMVTEWADDFWAFAAGVGERPGPDYRLRRHEIKQPIGPNNFFWDQTYATGDGSKMSLAQRAEYMREYRKRRPRNVKDTELKKYYGISLDDWERMYHEQGGTCAICKTCESQKSSRYANLAVDHCHSTGKVRGLLCNACNRAVGFIRDNPAVARAMADYLDR